MKSKISCFNWTVFRKNGTLYWPIWVFYSLYLLAAYPGRMWLSFYDSVHHGSEELVASNCLESLADIINIPGTVISIGIMAVITGMALYNYLCVAKSANMIHALPVTRGQLFGTNLISGLAFMAAPQLLAFLVSMPVCLSFGVVNVEYLGLYLAVEFGIDLLVFSMVTLCAMLSGQMAAIPVFFLIGNFLYLAVRYVISVVVPYLAYGVYLFSEGNFAWLSPIFYVATRVDYGKEFESGDNFYLLKSITLENGSVILWYALLAVVLYVISYLFYRKRQLENAGDLITVRFVRPVFRWGAAFMAAYVSAILLKMILDAESIGVPVGVLVVFGFVMGILCFFLAEMLLEKNFRVFRKKNVLEAACCGIFLLATFGGMHTIARHAENYIPQADEIECATVDMDFPVTVSGEDIQELLDIHRMILSHAEENRERDSWDDSACGILITYELKNKKTVNRYYIVSRTEDTAGMIASVYDWERVPEVFLQELLGISNEGRMEIESMALSSWDTQDDWGEEYYDIYDSWSEMGDDTKIPEDNSEETAWALYQAVIEDAQAGVLQKYNINELGVASDSCRMMYSADLSMEIHYYKPNSSRIPEVQENGYGRYDAGDESEDYYYYPSINFGSDCENILNALKEYGIIQSEEELHLYIDPEDVWFY